MLTQKQRFELQKRVRSTVIRSGGAYNRLRRLELVGRHLLRRPHEPDFAFFGRFASDRSLFLDIGANCGISAVSFRMFNRIAPILSLEPNPANRQDLDFTAHLVQPFSYRLVAAGRETGEATLYIPTYRGAQITALATFERSAIQADWRIRLLFGDRVTREGLDIEEISVPVVTVDSLNLNPGIVKIDVEGYEAAVIDGMERTLRENRPLLMLEWSREWTSIQSRLERFGYSSYTLRNGVLQPLTHEHALNVFCLHQDDV